MLSVEFLADAVRIYGSTARLISPHTNFNVVIVTTTRRLLAALRVQWRQFHACVAETENHQVTKPWQASALTLHIFAFT